MSDLRQAVMDRVSLRDTLLREYPALEGDDVALNDTLQGMDDFEERAVAWLRAAAEQEARADALASMIETMQARKQRLKGSAERLRGDVLDALQVVGMARPIRAPDMTVSVSPGRRKVIVTNEDAIPDVFCKIERKPLKNIIAAELARGIDVPGAILSNPVPYLSVRRG